MALSFYYLVLFAFEAVLGTLVLLRNFRTRANLLFFGVAISLAMWTLSWYFFVNSASLFWVRFTFVWGGFILSFYWLIGFYYLNKRRISRWFFAFLLIINTLITVLALAGNGFVMQVHSVTSFGYLSVPGPFQPLYRLFIAAGIVFAIVKLWMRIRSAETEETKAKLTWIFIGTLLFSIFAAFSSALAPVLLGQTNITGFGPLTSLPYTIFFAIAIVKYRISDIRASVYRGVLRIATIGVLFAALAIPFTSRRMMGLIMRTDRSVLFFAVMGGSFLIYLYFSKVIPGIDRFFSRREQLIDREVAAFRGSLNNVGSTEDLVNMAGEFLTWRFDFRVAAFVLTEGEGAEAVPDSVRSYLRRSPGTVEKVYLLSFMEIRPEEAAVIEYMEAKGGSMLMPFAFRDTIFGILVMDRENNGRLLGSHMLDALDTVRLEVSNVFFRIRLLRRLADSEAREYYTRELQEKNEQLSRRNRVIEQDMELARKIQRALIPQDTPDIEGIKIEKLFIPLEKIAGDFFDFFRLRRFKIGVFIGDVSGHGVPSALIASMAKMILNDLTKDELLDPAGVLAYLNRRLIDSMENNFITAFYGVVDIANNTFTYSGAAHPAMLLLDRGSGSLSELNSSGKAIGVIPDPVYENRTAPIPPGSRLFLFTDGCFEVFDTKDKLFGEERLAECILKHRKSSLRDIGSRLVDAVRAHSPEDALEDDFTLIMLETGKR